MKKFLKCAGSFTVALAMLMLNAPRISIARAEGELPSIPKTIFAFPSDLDTTWKKDGTGTLENPGGTNQYILFGSYQQSSNGSGGFNVDPIKWRILSNSDGKLFLMSDKLLDAKAYDSRQNQSGINWSNCALRTWLTGTFLNTAFTAAQQGKIADTTVNAPYATSSDWSTFEWQTPFSTVTDKLFILAGDYTDDNLNDNELRNTTYGFVGDTGRSPTRQFEFTDFAKDKNSWAENNYGAFWARSDFFDNTYVLPFYADPGGDVHHSERRVCNVPLAVAPALKIPLSSVLFSSAALGAASPSGTFSEISGSPCMMLRYSSDAQGTVTKIGSTVNYTSAPEGSSLVVVATTTDGKSYQYSQTLTSASGSVDLSSKGLAEASTYQAWIEKEIDGVLYASNLAVEPPPTTERIITYKNYDGSTIENLPASYPTTYTEGTALTLPADSPASTMSDFEFLGFWDEPLAQSKKVTVPGPGYEDEQTLDLTVGNKITEISAEDTGDITLYARYTSDVFDEDVNGRENYIFGAPGVFPNGSTANMRVLESGTQEYQDTLQNVDDKDINNIKIVEFQVLNSQGAMVQPNTLSSAMRSLDLKSQKASTWMTSR